MALFLKLDWLYYDPMKRLLGTLLILIMLLPAAAPWLPHGAVEVLHGQQDAHASSSHSHSHDSAFDTSADASSDAGHAAHVDAVSFFDSLHVDLKNPPVTKVSAGASGSQDMPVIVPGAILSMSLQLADAQEGQGPPVIAEAAPYGGLPVYLATQRLRI